MVRDSAGEVSDVNRWVGLGKKSPLVASVFSLFLLSFAGIPLTSGFVGKFSIFSAAYESGNITLVVVGVLIKCHCGLLLPTSYFDALLY
jgi:NADH-quinone oxidoreductase subunit N